MITFELTQDFVLYSIGIFTAGIIIGIIVTTHIVRIVNQSVDRRFINR